MRKLILPILLLASFVPLNAQISNNTLRPVSSAPSGSCGNGVADLVSPGGTVSTCQNGTWGTLGGGGSGTVNSGTAAQFAWYAGTGTAVSGDANLTDTGTVIQSLEQINVGATSGPYWQIQTNVGGGNDTFQSYNAATLEAEYVVSSGGNVFITYNGQAGGNLNINSRANATGVNAISLSGAGATTIGAALTVTGAVTLNGLTNAATGDYVCYNAGLIEFNTATCTLSLRKYKQDIHPLASSLAEVMALKPVEYRYKPEMKLGSKVQIGFIADDAAKVDPRIGAYKDNGELESVDYEHMVALLTSAIQEQQKEINQLKREIKRK